MKLWLPIVSMVLATSALISSVPGSALVPRTEELQNGRWVTIDQPAATQATIDPELLRIEDLINQGQYSVGSERCVEWLKKNPGAPFRDRALLLNAEALYRYGDRVKAFFYLDELLDEYPASPLYARALDKQYQIADEFLPDENRPEYKSRFLGLAVLSREGEAIEMLYRIQQRSPGSPLAERALLRTADYYYADAQYDLAADTYAAYARAYPRSAILARVKLRQAFANLAQFRGARFDATPAIDARVELTELIAAYPDLAAQENLPAFITRIDGIFAQKLFLTADFYQRTREPIAAVYTYRFLINAYPDSSEAQRAKIELQHASRQALDSPPPGGGPIGFPSATQPAASAQ